MLSAEERRHRRWDGYLAVVCAFVTVSVALDQSSGPPRRIVAVASLIGILALYWLVGRGLVRGEDRDPRSDARLAAFLTGILGLFLVALLGSTTTWFLLFAICPLIFLTTTLRPAILLVVLANLLPVPAILVQDGTTLRIVAFAGPMAVASTVFSVWMGVWMDQVVRQSKERAELIEQLERTRAEAARLSHEAGVAAERARLAGEIHDTLAQGFTSIITLLQAADSELDHDPDRARSRLALAVRTARENLAESRALVAALAPSALLSPSSLVPSALAPSSSAAPEQGTDATVESTAGPGPGGGPDPLDQAIRRQVDRFAEETSVRADYRTVGTVVPLPTAVQVVLLRAAQEALANVRRHAGAQCVDVRLEYLPELVRLTVRDDGRGFDTSAAVDGYGLRGMRTRAEQVSGSLTVHSGAGSGTTIELAVTR